MGFFVFSAGCGLVTCGILYIIAFFIIDTQKKSQIPTGGIGGIGGIGGNKAETPTGTTPGAGAQVPSNHGYFAGNDA